MKQIGHTEKGVLMECSEKEVRAFKILVDVTKGKYGGFYGLERDDPLDAEIADIFGAVSQWVQIAQKSNELRGIATRIDELMKTPRVNDRD